MFKSKILCFLIVAIMILTIQINVEATNEILYTHSTLGFSLAIPSSWQGLYRADEKPDGVNFIDINNEIQYDGFADGGFLFGIQISNYEFTEENSHLGTGLQFFKKTNGAYIYYTHPTDVQYDYNNPKLRNEYEQMQNDIAGILESFLLTTFDLTAIPTLSSVLVNSKPVDFDAYNVNDNNYFKLRDLAYALSGTAKEFEVSWDAVNNVISLFSGKAYTIVGGEMSAKGGVTKTPIASNAKIYLDGKEVSLTAYNIDGNNYFKLRDIGKALDFGVIWDDVNNTIGVDTAIAYTD